jgi:DNA-binding SARP family transcriptional activator
MRIGFFRATIWSSMDKDARLKVFALGLPEVEWAGQYLALFRRQVRALLFRLAVRRQPVSRSELCFLFWPDIAESRARRNLTRVLSQLRRELPTPELLIVSRERVGLEHERVWSDSVAFEHLCSIADGPHRLEVLQEAVTLYRGPYLSGFSVPDSVEFDAWVTSEARTFERQYLDALAALVDEHSTRGDLDAAIACARLYLEIDELAEEMHRLIIGCYAAKGDRTAAVRQFERCTAVLERELGVGPLPETRAVYDAALVDRFPLDASPMSTSSWRAGSRWDVPLIGRQDALRHLERAADRARSGQGSVVLISGDSGIGKSRLMHEFSARPSVEVLVMMGSCHPGAKRLPYHPIIDALRAHLASQGATLDVADVWLAEASRLFPELRTLYPEIPQPMPGEPNEARSRLFEALCQLIGGLPGGRRFVLLCLDDLQWADNATLDWLLYLGSQLRTKPMLLVGTVRSEESETINRLRRSLKQLGVVSEVSLKGLNLSDVQQLLRFGLNLDLEDSPLPERLWRATGGNPFFLIETVQAFIEPNRPVQELRDLVHLPLPDTVRDAINARLARLSPVARQIIEAGAVLESHFSFELLAMTAGRTEPETLDGLDELLIRRLISEEPHGFRFHHEIIETVVYQGLKHWRRNLLHRRAAQALQVMHSSDYVALARHFELAGQPGQAAAATLEAAQSARAVFAHKEARAFFDRALELLVRRSASLEEELSIASNYRLQLQAYHGRGWAFRLLGDMEAYERDTQKVARLAERLGDARTLAHLRWREAYAHRWFCRYENARIAAYEGVHLAQSVGDTFVEALCQRELGMVLRATGAYGRARLALTTALELFTELDRVVYQIHSLTNLATLRRFQRDYKTAKEAARQALLLCEQAGLALERRLPLGDLGAAEAGQGNHALARTYLEESLEIARRIADRTQEIFCLGHLGWSYLCADQVVLAVPRLKDALSLAERVNSCAERSWLHAGLAEAYRLQGGRDSRRRAIAHALQALEIAETVTRAHDVEQARAILAKIESSDA